MFETDTRSAAKTLRTSVWPVAMVIALGLAGCSSDQPDGLSQELLDDAARSLSRETAQITAEQLSDAIIADNRALDVIDLRPGQSYDSGAIKGSRNLPLTILLSAEGRAAIGVAPVVLISEDGTLAAQASALLHLSGVDAQVLKGGYEAWRQYLTVGSGTPALDTEAARDLAKRQAAACWFEGDYVAIAGLTPRISESMEEKKSAGYTPPMKPVQEAKADPLGLGLGLGLGPPPAEKEPPKKKRKLKVREGC